MFNKEKFRDCIYQNGMTLNNIASIMGVNMSTLYRKMNGDTDFTRNEIDVIRCHLHLSNDETETIFFAH